MKENTIILAIESSCDDTSASVIRDGMILSNLVATQDMHKAYGGVVPELASRVHQESIAKVVDQAMQIAKVKPSELIAIAFTRGPGLMGSLLVGVSFAKGMAIALDIPLIEVNHMQAHILAHFIEEPRPQFPFLCLTISGGHTEIVLIEDHLTMTRLGKTIDDAAGEAFDKTGKMIGLPYPAGPVIDKLAKEGKPIFKFSKPRIDGLDFSFSGLKTAILYFLKAEKKKDEGFIEKNTADICASVQATIIEILLEKIKMAADQSGIKEISIAGGVSANSGLRREISKLAATEGWNVYIPKLEYCTDNAAMIAMAGYYQFLAGDFSSLDVAPDVRMHL